MALVLAETVEPQDGCRGFEFNDSTGVYNATTNPGGYNTPNPDSTIVNLATINFYAPNSTIPYSFVFEIETGNIASVILTAPDGTETTVTSSFTDYSFPFEDMLFDETLFGFEENDSVTDGVWTVEYLIETEEQDSFNTTTYPLVTCTACCCITKMFVNLTDCGCSDDAIVKAQNADAKLKAAIYAANLGMMDEAQANIDKANEICNGNCGSCN